MKSKKIIAIILTVVLVGTLIAGAIKVIVDKKEKAKIGTDRKLKIVTTIFPEYDWVKQILGSKTDAAEVKMLLDNGVDLHSYKPTVEDLAAIKNCDIFIYVGGESDKWVEDALKGKKNPRMKVINLLDALGKNVKNEEVKEGMQVHEHEHEDDEHGHKHNHNHKHEHKHEDEKDEHVWLSIKNAKTIVDIISKAMEDADKTNSASYRENANLYMSKLTELDSNFETVVKEAKVKTLVFGDRFPFRYLVDDYGLDYFAAFVGCSAESEASFETISFLAKKIDSLNLHSVMTIEGKEHKIAETIIKNTSTKDQKILTMDSMQSTTSEDIKKGKTYLSVMSENLEVLKQAIK
ncbi:MAG: metal ABC transporter substrate-binding protein [Candidatus Fimenecus sp.]